MKRWIFYAILAFPLLGSAFDVKTTELDLPTWAKTQIETDFKPFEKKSISAFQIEQLYQQKATEWLLVKFKISNNQISAESKIPGDHFADSRINSYLRSLEKLSLSIRLPDMTFLLSIADGLSFSNYTSEKVPILVMSKHREGTNGILIPDFDVLANGFQVLKRGDITQIHHPWDWKAPIMIWRGSTAYWGISQTESNLDENLRIKLCTFSEAYPHLIDAKFTIFAQGAEGIPSLLRFLGNRISFEKQMGYKYHILIDGNACSYSASGWKLFTNSLLFKPNSPWIQWYYNDLKPWIHYVPVRADLSDLIEKIQWALAHDLEAKLIAENTRTFALEHISEPMNLAYLYAVLIWYNSVTL